MLVSAAKWINLPLPFDEMCFKLFYMRFCAKTICWHGKATTTCNMKTKIISVSYGKWHTNETGCMNYACMILWTHKETQTERQRGDFACWLPCSWTGCFGFRLVLFFSLSFFSLSSFLSLRKNIYSLFHSISVPISSEHIEHLHVEFFVIF